MIYVLVVGWQTPQCAQSVIISANPGNFRTPAIFLREFQQLILIKKLVINKFSLLFLSLGTQLCLV